MGGNIQTAVQRASTFKSPTFFMSAEKLSKLLSNSISYQYNQEGFESRKEEITLPTALHNCFVEKEIESISVDHLKENEAPSPQILQKSGTLIFKLNTADVSGSGLRSSGRGLKPVRYVLDAKFPHEATETIMSFLIEPKYETKNEKAVDQVFYRLLTNYMTVTGRTPQNILVFLETNGALSNFSGREVSEFLDLDGLRQKYKCYVRCQEHLRKQGMENGYRWLREVIENRLNDLSTDPTNYSLVGPRCIYE